jgi:hypothetical protein
MPAIARMARSCTQRHATRTARNVLVHSNHPPIPRSFIPSTDAAPHGAP